jgi:hypothetical protein
VYLGLLGLEWFDIVVPHFVLHTFDSEFLLDRLRQWM